MKKIAAIHDLSGYGRASLTVAIPILTHMGFQVCPLPTAILSAHSEYKDFRSLDRLHGKFYLSLERVTTPI